MPYVYIGKPLSYAGKTLWEIACSLKNFGVGRMVVSNRYKRYPETTYYRIVEAKPIIEKDQIRGHLKVYVVFRGLVKGIYDVSHTAYKSEFQLIPKTEEHLYVESARNTAHQPAKIFAPTVEMPPLLKLIAQRNKHSTTTLKTLIVENDPRIARVAKEGETPTDFVVLNRPKPVNPDLFKDVRERRE